MLKISKILYSLAFYNLLVFCVENGSTINFLWGTMLRLGCLAGGGISDTKEMFHEAENTESRFT